MYLPRIWQKNTTFAHSHRYTVELQLEARAPTREKYYHVSIDVRWLLELATRRRTDRQTAFGEQLAMFSQ